MSFSNLGLSTAVLQSIDELGHQSPTPIQTEAIPLVLAGHDLLAAAQTGTGKTGAFAMPIIERLKSRGSNGAGPRALVLAPTRELAAQVTASFAGYARHTSLRVDAVFGGVGMHKQSASLRRGLDVLVATPGRLIDHLERRAARLSNVEILVLDEADRMLDMGFLPAIRRIIDALPKSRQNLLFSATFSAEIRKFAATLLHEPRTVEVAPRNSTAANVVQRVHFVNQDNKRALLLHLLRTENWRQTLVFARTKHGAERLAEQLEREGILATAIHGNKSQNARTRALAQFKQGQVLVLVATDVAARGIDVERLSHVVNFDLPSSPEDYVHRIGRTGRAGASGEAVSLVSGAERKQLRDIERMLGKSLSVVTVEGFETTSPAQDTQRAASAEAGARRRHAAPRGQRPGTSHGHRRDNKGRSKQAGSWKPSRGGH
ncbi:MAG: DEAD/DEAH box helicase [Gammaproteobacteria bacterium]